MTTFTFRGFQRILTSYYRNENTPVRLYLALCNSTTTPTQQTNTLGELTQISGGGYADGGFMLNRNTTDFDSVTAVSSQVTAYMRDMVVVAVGGSLTDVKHIVLTDDNATIADREVLAYVTQDSSTTVSNGNDITLENIFFRWGHHANGGLTTQGMLLAFQHFFNSINTPTGFYLALAQSTPTAATDTMGGLTETPSANGYASGGSALARGIVDFPTAVDGANSGYVATRTIGLTALGGDLGPATHAVLTTDQPTVANRHVLAYASLGGSITATEGQILTLRALNLVGT